MTISKNKFLIICLFAIIIAGAFMKDTAGAPFINGKDNLSNLQPIVHYRYSILVEHRFPFYTSLWFGGRFQWQNPLWSFLYLPATIFFLLLPLGFATKFVFFIHLWASIVSGWWLSGRFLKKDQYRMIVGIILASPMTAMMVAGHFEKIFSWPWILLGTGVLLSTEIKAPGKGLMAGVCLGIVALTGSNYYTLYAMIFFTILSASYFSRVVFTNFLLGSSIGLLHMPSVFYMIGINRGLGEETVKGLSISFVRLFTSLFIGYDKLSMPIEWESYALIGLPIFIGAMISFIILIWLQIKNNGLDQQQQLVATALSGLVFIGFTTGFFYKGLHFLDTFRVPCRIDPFIALVVVLICLFAYKSFISSANIKFPFIRVMELLIVFAGIQVGYISWILRPYGTNNWITDPGLNDLALYLKSEKANNVWMNIEKPFEDPVIPIAMNIQGVSVVNTYYGDMGQTISISGPYCGYSFEYLLIPKDNAIEEYKLIPFGWGRDEQPQKINKQYLEYKKAFKIMNRYWDVYSIRCDKLSNTAQ